jgi:hypothetical protein
MFCSTHDLLPPFEVFGRGDDDVFGHADVVPATPISTAFSRLDPSTGITTSRSTSLLLDLC